MIRCDVDFNINSLTDDVTFGDDGVAECPARFVIARLRSGEIVAAGAAFPSVLIVLDAVAAAKDLIVVVVDGVGEAEAPHDVSRRRLHEAAVTRSRSQEGTKKKKLLHPSKSLRALKISLLKRSHKVQREILI